VLEQVANGVSVRMAVLYLLLAGERGGAGSTVSEKPAQRENER
jgi:aspartate carbamoyltransferase catalytic subunit